MTKWSTNQTFCNALCAPILNHSCFRSRLRISRRDAFASVFYIRALIFNHGTKTSGKFREKISFYLLHLLYIHVRRGVPYIFCKFLQVSQFSRDFYPFLGILTKKKLGKAAKQFTSTTRFPISFFYLLFLFSWAKSIKARTPDGVVETQFLQNFGSFCANFWRWYFFKSIELRRSTFRRTISMRSLKSALKDHEVGHGAV